MKTENAKQPEAAAPATTTPHKITPKNFLSWLVVVVLLLLALAASLVLKHKYGYNPTGFNEAKENQQPSHNRYISGDLNPVYRYSYTSIREAGEDFDGKNVSGKIFRTNINTGEQQVVVPDVLKAFYDSDRNGAFYTQLAQSSKNPYVYLTRLQSDRPVKEFGQTRGIFRYDGSQNKFTKLSFSDTYESEGSSASPSEAYLLSVNNEESPGDHSTLYLIDLDNEKIIELEKLPKGETFSICTEQQCLASFGTEVVWYNGHDFETAIYDDTDPKLGQLGYQRQVIKYRKSYYIKQYINQ